jgi:hypothetical protein
MALVPCIDCKKEISDDADTCPNCGSPPPVCMYCRGKGEQDGFWSKKQCTHCKGTGRMKRSWYWKFAK